MLTRRGATLTELLVAVVLAAVVLGAATMSLLRQHQSASLHAAGAEGGTQLRMATGMFAAQLALLEPADLDRSHARDSTLQFRAVVATGHACSTDVHPSLVIGGGDLSAGGMSDTPRTGDSLWWYRSEEDGWRGGAVQGVEVAPGACPQPVASAGGERALVLRLSLGAGDTIPVLTPLRITRPQRLVLYRAGDGSTQLGQREWNAAAGEMNSPQPAAGPFLRTGPGGLRSGFRFYDSGGAELFPSSEPDAGARVARLRLHLLSPPKTPFGAVIPRDSADVALGRGSW